MHKCLKCGRIITDVAEINEGCGCGSKVFVFIKGNGDEGKSREPGRLSVMDFTSPLGKPANEAASVPPAPEILPPQAPVESVQKPAAEILPPVPEILPPEEGAKGEPAQSQTPEILPPAPEMLPPATEILPPTPEMLPQAQPELQNSNPHPSSIPSRAESLQNAANSDIPPLAPGNSSQPSEPEKDNIKFVSEEGLEMGEVWLAKGGLVKPIAEGDVENVRQVAQGVFELDVGALSSGPLVVKDENGVFYVRLPFSQGKEQA